MIAADLRRELNQPQLEAVLQTDGPMLVFAGAGSGKTRVITFRAAHIVSALEVPAWRVMCVTFTNKATGEMKHRLTGLLGAQVAKELWVATFHATGAKLLRKYHERVNLSRDFAIYDESDQRQVMNRVYGETFATDPPARATAVVDLMSPDSTVEITFIASQQPKKSIGGAAPGIAASAAVQAGPRVWLSGVIGDTEKHPRDITAQARDVFTRMQTTMNQAGVKYADVVDTTVYIRDWSEWPKIDAVFREIFPANPPARNSTAARLVVEPGLVEVLLTAIKK